MATRPLTNAEVPVLESIRLEPEPLALRRLRAAGSWARGALVLDLAMLLAGALAAELGSRGAGIASTAPVFRAIALSKATPRLADPRLSTLSTAKPRLARYCARPISRRETSPLG